MKHTDLKTSFQEHGWVLVKNVFSEKDIQDMRNRVSESHQKGYKGDFLSNPLFRELIYDDKILNILRQLIGNDLYYFGDTAFLLDNNKAAFHKDNPDRNNIDAPDWKGDYDVVRVGIYLQDHTNSSGGLLLRDKSHKTMSIEEGTPFNVPIQKGDVAVWYLSTTHSGSARIFSLFPKIIVNPKYYQFFPSFLFQPEKINRIGLAMSYGNGSKHMNRYLDYLKTRKYAVKNWQESVYDPSIIEEAEKHGLKIMDMRPEAMQLDLNSLNELHKDIPF